MYSSKRLVTLARGLSPAYLRFGGKRTDFLQFHNLKNLAKFRGPGPDYYLKNYEDGELDIMDLIIHLRKCWTHILYIYLLCCYPNLIINVLRCLNVL